MSEEAIVLINSSPDQKIMEKVYEKVKSMDKVEKAAMLAGPYDIIAWVKTETTRDISVLIKKIRNITGVKKTTTYIVI